MKKISSDLAYYSTIILLVPVGLFIINSHYGWQDVLIILKQAAFLSYTVLGAAVLQISGEFLLCSGAIIALSMSIAQFLCFNLNLPAFWIAAATFAAAGLTGLILGFLSTGMGIPSLLLTFAMEYVLRGISNELHSQLATASTNSTIFSFFAFGSVLSIPFWLIVFAIMFILVFVLLYRTYFGRCLFAVGSNAKAAARAGLSVHTIKVLSFVIGCMMVNTSTLFMLSWSGFNGSNFASSTSLDALVVLCLGGVSLYGGKGRLRELLFAILCFTMIQSIFSTLNIPAINFQITKGIILMGTLWIQNRSRGKIHSGDILPEIGRFKQI